MLTPRKAKFVAAYARTGNALQSAIEAGYSPATAKQQGSRLLTDVDVVNMLREVNGLAVQVVAEAGEAAVASAEWWLRRTAEIARQDKPDRVAALTAMRPILFPNLDKPNAGDQHLHLHMAEGSTLDDLRRLAGA